jgi:RNA polymerase sigma-70 factor, ECF subfamily
MAVERALLDLVPDRTMRPDADPVSDAGLVHRMVDGSQQALANLYDRYGDTVFATAMRTCRDRGAAAEVVQETFLSLWNRAESFDPARGSLSAWLATIARNRAVDHLRAAARRDRAASFSSFAGHGAEEQWSVEWLTAAGELIGAAEPEPGPEMALSGKETRASVRDAVTSLAPAERCVIELAYNAELSQSEIAGRLGWPIGTVKTRTRRALRHLRDRLEGPSTGAVADAPCA